MRNDEGEIPRCPEPTVTCSKCGAQLVVSPFVRGFPPDVARKKLKRSCVAKGCDGEPRYRVGVA